MRGYPESGSWRDTPYRVPVKPMRTRLLLSLSLLSLVAAAHAIDTWDLTNDFSFTSNPNGVWSYGDASGGSFVLDASMADAGVFRGWSNDPTDIWKNITSTQQYGIDSGQISLECDGGRPDARWTAPYTGLFTVDVVVGAAGNPGNSGVPGSELLVDGVNQTATSYLANVKTFEKTVTLAAGKTIDAVGGQMYYGGNTQLAFTVIGQPVPEPASLAALGVGALSLLRRRRRA